MKTQIFLLLVLTFTATFAQSEIDQAGALLQSLVDDAQDNLDELNQNWGVQESALSAIVSTTQSQLMAQNAECDSKNDDLVQCQYDIVKAENYLDWITKKIQDNLDKIDNLETHRCDAQRTFIEGMRIERMALKLIDMMLATLDEQEGSVSFTQFSSFIEAFHTQDSKKMHKVHNELQTKTQTKQDQEPESDPVDVETENDNEENGSSAGSNVVFTGDESAMTGGSGATFAEGVWTFDGSGAITFDFADAAKIPEHNFEISLKFKTTMADVGVLSLNAPDGGHDRHFALQGGKPYHRTWQGQGWTADASPALNDDQWHTWALKVQDGVGQECIIDGNVVGTNSYDHSDFDWKTTLTLGNSNDVGILFIGQISDVQITGNVDQAVENSGEVHSSETKTTGADEVHSSQTEHICTEESSWDEVQVCLLQTLDNLETQIDSNMEVGQDNEVAAAVSLAEFKVHVNVENSQLESAVEALELKCENLTPLYHETQQELIACNEQWERMQEAVMEANFEFNIKKEQFQQERAAKDEERGIFREIRNTYIDEIYDENFNYNANFLEQNTQELDQFELLSN